ncbi:MAG TPA: hypothetical protein VM261_25570 [Kofleriaceae bacterium]|nr:hypothetical protein [Kofleriaceae bacterium]
MASAIVVDRLTGRATCRKRTLRHGTAVVIVGVVQIFQKFEGGGARELIGRRHRALTVTGGLLVCLAAGLVIARASGMAALAAAAVLAGPALGTVAAAMPTYRGFRAVGFAFLLVNGLVLCSLVFWVLGAWKSAGYFSPTILIVMLAWAAAMLGLVFSAGRQPPLEWRIATMLWGSNALVIAFHVMCPKAPAPGSNLWIMVGGLTLITAGIVAWRLEMNAAARASIPVARARG